MSRLEPAALVEMTKRFIASNLDRRVTLSELSKSVHCSPWQLCRTFRRVTGRTITSYRHALRIEVALERIRDHRTDLTDLALELGYSSHSHFTQVFRRHIGTTPSQVRKIER